MYNPAKQFGGFGILVRKILRLIAPKERFIVAINWRVALVSGCLLQPMANAVPTLFVSALHEG